MGASTGRHVEGRPYVPGIDGLRALAVLSVMVFHLMPGALPGGFVGVDVFFVISGYVVTGSLARDAGLPFGRFIAAFYARRFKRIVPALVVCLGVTVLLNAALVPDAWLSQAIRATALAAFFGLSNFALTATNDGYFATRSEFNPFTHTWSLAVEEQFYVLFPLLAYLWIGQRAAAWRRPARGLLLALSLASLVWCAWITTRAPDQAYYMLPSRFWELAVGAGLYLMGGARREALVRRWGQAVVAGLGLAMLALALALAQKQGFPWPWALPAVLGSALLILAVSVAGPARAGWLGWLASPPMVRIGLWSYSLYLWHWPIYTLMRWTVGLDTPVLGLAALAATASCAALSYRFVEQPVARSVHLARLPSGAVVALGCAVVVVARMSALQVFGLPQVFKHSVVAQQRGDWYPEPLAQPPADWAAQAHCNSRTIQVPDGAEIHAADCRVPAELPGARLFVLGDSHAGAYLRLLDGVVRITGIGVHQFSHGACPLAGLMRPVAALGERCAEFQRRAEAAVLATARAGDVVLLAGLRVPRLGDQDGPMRAVPVDPAMAARKQAARDAAWHEADALVGRFEAAGLRVIIDSPKPVFASPPFRCSDPFNRMNPVCVGGFRLPRATLEAHRSQAVAGIQALAARHPAMRVWDPLPDLCSADVCAALDADGRPLFFDGDHLSGHGNDRLLPGFLAVLRAALASR